MLILLFVFVWLRGTMPRLRYDQFMRFGWKVLIPINLVWILALAGVKVMQNSHLVDVAKKVVDHRGRRSSLVAAPFLLAPAEADADSQPGDVPPQEGGFPVPPMDLTVPPSPRLPPPDRRSANRRRSAPIVDADSSESEV